MPEHQQTQQSTESKTTSQSHATPRIQAPLSHPMAIIQRAKINPKSLTHADVMQLQRTIGNRAVGRLLSEIGLIPSKAKQAPPVQRQELVQRQEIPEEEGPLQGKFGSELEKETCSSCMQRQAIPEEEEPFQGKMIGTLQRQEILEEEEPLQGKFENKPEIACSSCFATPILQRQTVPEEEPLQGKMTGTLQLQEIPEEEPLQTKRENNTGIPDNLKTGVESLSGIDMSDVKVHYNSSKPGEVGALAYTQGMNIHVAPGQEKHLPHEVWHVVQQAQGRVQPTMQLKDGVPVNDDERLEHEADMKGAKALQIPYSEGCSLECPLQKKADQVVQLRVGFEFETCPPWRLAGNSRFSPPLSIIKNKPLATGNNWSLVPDGDSPEFVTQPYDEVNNSPALAASMTDLNAYTTSVTANIGLGAVPLSIYPGVTRLGRLFNIVPGDANMPANPQFTAGISLASLRPMMRRLGTAGSNAHATLNNLPGRSDIMAQAAAGAQFPGFSEQYRGIVALMGAYTSTSARLQFPTFYKDVATMMSRTKFGVAFQTTAEYQGAAGNRVALAALKTQLANHIVVSATAVAGALPGGVVVNTGMLMLPGIVVGMPDPDNIPARTGPTLQAWANSIVDGGDALEGSMWNLIKWMRQNNTIGLSAISSISMGSMNNMEAVGPGGMAQGQIIEYRNLPTDVPHNQWQTLANNLLNWVTRLNDPVARGTGNTDY